MGNQNVWMRVAGNAAKIKANDPYRWRCYVEGSLEEIPLKGWFVVGESSLENFRPGTNPIKDQHGLVAWVDCFGSYTIENEVLYITPKVPSAPPIFT